MEKTNEFKADLIEVAVKGGLKTEHTFRSAEGDLGVLRLNGLATEGSFEGAADPPIQVKKASLWKAVYELDQAGSSLGSAAPVKISRRAYAVEFKGTIFSLVPEKVLSRTWRLLDQNGEALCEIKPRGLLKRGALIQILSPIDLNLLAFTYFLVFKRWQEESSAS